MRFIISILLATLLSAGIVAAPPLRIEGRVTCDGQGVAGVPITDGATIAVTDNDGQYSLYAYPDSKFIYYTLPSGYESPAKEGLPQFFARIDKSAEKQRADFELLRSALPRKRHALILTADPQICFEKEFELWERTVDDIRDEVRSLGGIPVIGMSAGDIVFDKLHFFKPYAEVVARAGVPFYHLPGNHDMDYNLRSDERSYESFTDVFGPAHYSFNVGDIHYVALRNSFYFGDRYRYIGYITERQLAWLESDLSRVAPGSTVVVCMHIPTRFGDTEKAPDYRVLLSNSVMNAGALYKILEPYNTHILAGHSHTQWNTILSPRLFEHVHAAASGAWWQGPVCVDGSPAGYTVYIADGDSLSWYFKGTGLSRDEQLRVYGVENQVVANVFNYDPAWKVVWKENGVVQGEMERFWGVDPLAAELYPKGGNPVFKWLDAGETAHLFRAVPNDASAAIEVEATDRFGRTYTAPLRERKDG